MPLTGYPDWQRINYATGFQLYQILGAVTAFTNSANFNTTPWSSILVSLQTGGLSDTYAVALTWFQDLAQTQQVGFTDIVIGPGSKHVQAVPVQGPFLTVSVNPLVGGNNTTVQMYFYGMGIHATAFNLSSYIKPTVFDNSTYAANQVKSFIATQQHYGVARLAVERGATGNYQATVQYFDFNSATWNGVALAFPDANGAVNLDVALPAAPQRVVVTNGTTGQVLVASLVPRS